MKYLRKRQAYSRINVSSVAGVGLKSHLLEQKSSHGLDLCVIGLGLYCIGSLQFPALLAETLRIDITGSIVTILICSTIYTYVVFVSDLHITSIRTTHVQNTSVDTLT